jgi:hypothetical protein
MPEKQNLRQSGAGFSLLSHPYTPMKFSINCVSVVRALGLFLLLMQVVPAQVAPAQLGASSPKEEAVRLSPFVIAS